MSEIDSSAPARGWLARLQETRLPIWVSLLLLILLLVVFAWQRQSVYRAEVRLADERTAMVERFAADRAALTEQARQQADEMHRRFGMALAWAVRSEMIRNNLDQVDQFFAEMVKLQGVKLVMLAAPDGKVLVSSDRRNLGANASTIYPAEVMTLAQIDIRAVDDGMKLLTIPVMGLNARLGTVLVRYQDADPLAKI